MYAEVWSIVEGCEDRSMSVEGDGYDEARALAEDLRGVSAVEGPLDWEVYVLVHDHEALTDDDECVCVQYLTDHHPTYSSAV